MTAPPRDSAPPRLILFDFDGTLVDSFHAVLAAGNRLAPRFGYPPLSESDAEEFREKSTRQILSRSDIPWRKLPLWMREMKRELHRDLLSLQPHPGISTALAKLREHGAVLGIVTSNSAENLHQFLERHGWTGHFSHLESGSTLFGKSRLIRRAMEKIKIPASATVYVGDETRDIEAARKSGVRAIAVAWGFNNRAALAATSPDRILTTPAELETL